MEVSDKDEGYISPLDTVETHVTENGYRNCNNFVEQPKPCLSWGKTQKSIRGENQENSQSVPSRFITDNAEDSARIIDNLWLILPESQERRIGSNVNNFLTERQSFVDSDSSAGAIASVMNSVPKPNYISLSEFIRDVIDLLCGKQSQTFLMSKEKIFCKNPAVLVHGLTPSIISNYCEPFLRIGSLIVELNQIEESFHFQTSVLSSLSVVCVRFVKFIKDYIQVYQTIVMLKRSSILSLTSLRRFIQPYKQQIQTLWNIVRKQVFASPVLLLKNLNSFMLKIEIPCVSELLQNLLVSCASAYSKYVSDWIFRGRLGSPLEFHIIQSRNAISKDRRFWTQQFSQNEDIPKFLKSLKHYMFNTGRAINLLKELQQNNNLPTYFDYDTDLYVELELTHEGTINLLNTNGNKFTKFLKQNSYLQDEIRQAVQSVTMKGRLVEVIDFKSVKQNEEECKLRLEAEQRQQFLKFQERKQSQMVEILENLKEARLLRLRQAFDELFDEKARQAYIRNKEHQDLQRGYDLLEQFYGDFVIRPEQNIQSREKGLSQTAISKCNEFNACGDIEMDEPNNDVDINESLNSDTPKFSNTISNTGSQSVQRSPSSEDDTSSSLEMPIEVAPAKVPFKSEKIHSKDFKTKPVVPFTVDVDIFSHPLIPTAPSNSGEIMLAGDECDEFLTNRFLSLSVEIPLMTQHKMVNLTLLHHVIVTKQLIRHVKAFHDYLLLQNGLFGYFLNTMLIDRVKKGLLRNKEEIPNQITGLNHVLEEVLSMVTDTDEINFLKFMRFDVVRDIAGSEKEDKLLASSSSSSTVASSVLEKPKKQALTSEFDVLNSLTLHYTVEWPLNIIFTNEFVRQYQLVFSLQMRLFRAELLLAGAAMNLKSKTSRSPQLLQLNSYRYIMLHFVQTVRSYINVTVIHTSWCELIASFSQMDSLEKIYELLVHHIKSVSSNCLLGPKAKAVMKLLINQLIVIEAFCCKLEAVMAKVDWEKGQKINSIDYKRLVQAYMVFMEIQKVFVQATFTVVQKGYYVRVGHFLDLFNFNKYYDLR